MEVMAKTTEEMAKKLVFDVLKEMEVLNIKTMEREKKQQKKMRKTLKREKKQGKTGKRKCSTCSQTFSKSEKLKEHLKKMQHGIRCKNCNISFNKNESLRQHQENSGKCKKKKDKRRENKSVTKKKKFIFVWPLNKKDVPVKEECDCGKIHYDIDKCRYFGEYRCYKCKNRWKSGWTWYGEYQKCIKCGKKKCSN